MSSEINDMAELMGIKHDDDLGSVLVPVSLRDWLAGQALAGLMQKQDAYLATRDVGQLAFLTESVATFAYAVADAMLAARGGGR